MRIGGIVSGMDGRELHCIRRKATQGTLRDQDDVGVIPDSELESFLGDVDRDLFCTLFGIDHTTLRRGGEDWFKVRGNWEPVSLRARRDSLACEIFSKA